MKTRFAPSPTGALHLGAMRTALFSWLAARAGGGRFVLRIEDTDRARHVPGSEVQILESLRWLRLDWDEGPETGGPDGPYVQSQRSQLHRQHAERLAEVGAAYWCTCSPERLAAMRAEQRAAGRPSRYDRRCAGRPQEVAEERASGMPAVLRQLMPAGRTEWQDLVRGRVAFDNAEIDDSVLLKADGYPTYHLAVVVDDHLMGITHVVRAEEWIPSTPKHLALSGALGWDPPRYAHVPLVLDEDRQKLSKRRGARDILAYRELGYLPGALANTMALLGWASGTDEEVFSLEELVGRFSLERVNPSPAVLDRRRLDDLNGVHIRRLGDAELVEALRPFVPGLSDERLGTLLPLLRERMVRLGDATELCAPLLGEAPWADQLAFPPPKVDRETAAELLDRCADLVRSGRLGDPATLREQLTATLEARGVRARDGFRVLYIAILGRPAGLPVFDAMAFIGPGTTLERLAAARARLGPPGS